MADKPHINLVFIGHVDHGKSTTIGRVLWDTENLPEEEMRKLEEAAEEAGKESFNFAFAMDSLEEERERGVTIDLAHQEFDSDNYHFTIIDAPGHRDFIKNMITGASQADAAVLVVAADDGIQPQTKEHAYLAKTLGIDQLAVAVNKMDLADYGEDGYNDIKDEVSEMIQQVGYDTSDIDFVPISAFDGEGVVENNEMDWYSGPTLVDALDDFEEPEKAIELSTRIPVQDVYTISGIGAVSVGRVETGDLSQGDDIVFQPASDRLNRNIGGEVKTIEMHHEEVESAEPGDNIGWNTRGVGEDDIKKGDVAGPADNPPTVVDSFKAQVIVLNHPNVISEGYTPVFHVNTAQVSCTFTDLHETMNPKTGETLEEDPDYIKQGQAAKVTITPQQPLVIEENDDIPQMARFAIRDMGQTVGAGQALEVNEKE
ncbi:translation elongation factor EF-1 subunit alpha [Candidatus Nanohalobium constans]|uniref:Elongation factor 1-alpha n=1 Tax=Candidatus Nanohalobium constans TaxID=2565781 RepID=A0A5Q0UGP9_9ARCH|nr:translation elongation factor EF-1 subunit alpha [Candidatus Nanohalobium constans]QGA80787.1 translation elongation factor EF-1 subunit alpha [Candidatus Nanohalobium constans]